MHKSTIVVSKDFFSVNTDIHDPRFDVFEPLPIALGMFEDEPSRKLNRKRQMAKRMQIAFKKVESGILKTKSKDPTIKLELLDDDADRKGKIRKQVSISEEPRLG